MKFRKKPIVIEARKFETNNDQDDRNMNELVLWVRGLGGHAQHDRTDIYIDTLEGQMQARVGDWIIRGVKGEFYPCKPDIFAATYEPTE
jgi:hypothetical protein